MGFKRLKCYIEIENRWKMHIMLGCKEKNTRLIIKCDKSLWLEKS